MGDLTDKEASGTMRIVGRDEVHSADVVQDFDGKNKLLTISDTKISSDLKIIHAYDLNISLDGIIYYDIYNQSGIITLSGFAIEFNDKKVFIRLEIDGQEVFDINIEKFKSLSNLDNAMQPPLYVSWNNNLKVFYFTPNFPIKSNTNIKIQARSKLGQSNKYISSILQVS